MSWLDYPRGIIASRSEMFGMGGASEAFVILSLRSDNRNSVKCYRRGEFGTKGEAGAIIWSRIGSSIGLTVSLSTVIEIQKWSNEIEAEVDWQELTSALRQAYPTLGHLVNRIIEAHKTLDN